MLGICRNSAGSAGDLATECRIRVESFRLSAVTDTGGLKPRQTVGTLWALFTIYLFYFCYGPTPPQKPLPGARNRPLGPGNEVPSQHKVKKESKCQTRNPPNQEPKRPETSTCQVCPAVDIKLLLSGSWEGVTSELSCDEEPLENTQIYVASISSISSTNVWLHFG